MPMIPFNDNKFLPKWLLTCNFYDVCYINDRKVSKGSKKQYYITNRICYTLVQ